MVCCCETVARSLTPACGTGSPEVRISVKIDLTFGEVLYRAIPRFLGCLADRPISAEAVARAALWKISYRAELRRNGMIEVRF